MAQTNVQAFSGDVEISGETVLGTATYRKRRDWNRNALAYVYLGNIRTANTTGIRLDVSLNNSSSGYQMFNFQINLQGDDNSHAGGKLVYSVQGTKNSSTLRAVDIGYVYVDDGSGLYTYQLWLKDPTTDTTGNMNAYLNCQGYYNFDTGVSDVAQGGAAPTNFQDGIVGVMVNNTGNVGIGTTGPKDVTHIYKSGANDDHGLLIEQNNVGTGSATLKFGVADTTESTAGLSKAGIFFKRGDTNGRGDLLFCMDNADDTNDVDTSNHALTIYRDGNVGIGTTEPVSGLTVSKDIESTNSFITERVLFKETWPNGLNSLVGDLGTWVVTNLNQQSGPSVEITPDGYGIVAFNGVPADNGEFVSPAFDLSAYALSDGVLPAINKRKTTTRVFLKCYFGTRNLTASGEVAHVQFSPDNGSTWYTVATSQDENNTDRFTMLSADLSPYILETSTNAKIRFYMPWSVAGGDYMRIGRIWIHESDVPTNLGGMWLGAGGNIGIGTTNPGYKLHVVGGDISLSGGTSNFDSSLIGGYSNRTKINMNLDPDASDCDRMTISLHDDECVRIRRNYNSGINSTLFFGNVGIGTTNPVGVNGAGRLEGSSTTGFEYIATRDDNSIDDGDFIGGYLFKNADTAGTEPHYAGMAAYAFGTNGNMDLRFFAGRDVYEDTPLEPHMIIDKNGNVGIGTESLIGGGPGLQIYADGTDDYNPGGGITLMRYRASDNDMRGGSIFSMAFGGQDCLIFTASSTANPYDADRPHVRMRQASTAVPFLEVVENDDGGVKFSNVFMQASGSVGRHYEGPSDGVQRGSSLHFSGDTIYPADYAGTINNDVINFGTTGNRWKNVYTKLANVDDATGLIKIGNGSASHHHSVIIKRPSANGYYHLCVGTTTDNNGGDGYISFGNSNHGVARNGRGQNSGRFGNTTDANDIMVFTAGNGGAWLINGNDQYLGINSGGGGVLNGNTIATTSDRRIKKDIEDIDDVSALEKLRLLMPKTYKYKDKKLHDQRVYGFIAQEVGEVLPYATSLRDNIIPNIQEFGIVSDSNVITFTHFNTNDLESNTNGMVAISQYDSTLDALQRSYVNLVEVIDEHSIRVDKNLEDLAYSLDGDGNVITETVTTTLTQEEYDDLDDKDGYEAVGDVYTKTVRTSSPGNTLYVFGQNVSDFVFLDKPSIFTVATAALQEVDRQQQADKLRIGELETQITSVLARLDALENP
jgi:hypothetical protein